MLAKNYCLIGTCRNGSVDGIDDGDFYPLKMEFFGVQKLKTK